MVAAGCTGCSPTVSPADAGQDAAADIAVDVNATDSPIVEAAPCTPEPQPAYVPAGWVPYDDYAPCTGLYIPTDVSQLPAPITWMACESSWGVPGCRRIDLNWGPPIADGAYTDTDARVDATNHVIVMTSRDYAGAMGSLDHRVNFVADADGPVYAAIMATQPGHFLPNVYHFAPSFTPPRWLWGVTEYSKFDTNGYIAGTIPQLKPSTHGHYSSGAPPYSVGDLGVLQGLTLLDFTTGAPLAVVKGSLAVLSPWPFGSYLFAQGTGGLINDVERWDLDAGSVDFINYSFDPSHPAGGLGTDGVDMVWIEAHGPPSDIYSWSTADYWTSPYATNPATITPRRLTAELPDALLGVPVIVGCGMAAFVNDNGLRIVRISDGSFWMVPNVNGSPVVNWQQALAVTCTEVFVRVAFSGPVVTMARVAVASLGAPSPPQ